MSNAGKKKEHILIGPFGLPRSEGKTFKMETRENRRCRKGHRKPIRSAGTSHRGGVGKEPQCDRAVAFEKQVIEEKKGKGRDPPLGLLRAGAWRVLVRAGAKRKREKWSSCGGARVPEAVRAKIKAD